MGNGWTAADLNSHNSQYSAACGAYEGCHHHVLQVARPWTNEEEAVKDVRSGTYSGTVYETESERSEAGKQRS